MATENSFPRTAMLVCRDEVDQVPLEVIEGSLPDGLGGHLFAIGPVGNMDTPAVGGDRDALLNGDGMVYRIDFGNGATRVSSRLVKTDCYRADAGTQPGSKWHWLEFFNAGIARVSPLLGFRDFGNTAFVPMLAKNAAGARLLVTYDAGRPVEIDPVTLETVTAVGYNAEWQGEAELLGEPFKLVLTSAHPMWDTHTGELFTVNYGRGIRSLLDPVKSPRGDTPPPQPPGLFRSLAKAVLDLVETTDALFDATVAAATGARTAIRKVLGITTANSAVPTEFVRVVKWDGEGDLHRWDVVLPDGNSVCVQDSMHQIAVTEDYVLLVDTNFKVGVNQWLYNPKPWDVELDRFVRLLLAQRQQSVTRVYIIKRADLALVPAPGTVGKVVARPLTLPFGAVHFLADYANPGGRVTMHLGHGSALDIAEWVRTYDRLPTETDGSSPPPAWLSGMITGAVDISRIGRYEIDAETATVRNWQISADEDDALWSLALYAANGVPAWGAIPEKLGSTWWFSNGYWPQLFTRFVYKLYKRYPDRIATIDRLLAVGRGGGAPPCLFRVDGGSARIAEKYFVPAGTMLSSPQFVPHRDHLDDEAHGWIVAAATTPDRCELWVFDACALAKGPVAKLASPSFRFGFTLHTAWLPVIVPRTSTYRVDPRVDYGPSLVHRPELQQFFDEVVFPPPVPPVRAQASGTRDAIASTEPRS